MIVLVAALSGGVVWWAGAEDRRLAGETRQTLQTARGEYFTAFPVRDSAGDQQGSLFAYQGDPSWLYLALDRPLPDGKYDFALFTRDGARHAVREDVEMTGRRGWGTTMQLPVPDVARLSVYDEAGALVLTARFAS